MNQKSFEERVKGSPVIGVLVFCATTAAATWMVSHELFVRPRDERLADLREDLKICSQGRNSSDQDSTNQAERKIVERAVADRLEEVLRRTKGKGGRGADPYLDETEIFYKRLRQAVFLNFDSFQADDAVLEAGLRALAARGHPVNDVVINKIIAEQPILKTARLRWLEDTAIPSLRRAEAEQSPMVQSSATVEVELPRLVWILDDGKPTVSVGEMVSLEEEVDLLKRRI